MMKPTDEEVQSATQSDLFEQFLRDLDGATRVVVETRNALGVYDASYMPAPRLRAALLRACKGRVKPLELAVMFHEAYESLAPEFGYETRQETRKFDPASPNGQLMIAVTTRILAALEQEPRHE